MKLGALLQGALLAFTSVVAVAWEAVGARGVIDAGQLFSVALIPLFFMPLLYTELERKGEEATA
ncbi:hypothetical protein ACWGKS_27225 [Nocardiopsis sp. NPDC055879]